MTNREIIERLEAAGIYFAMNSWGGDHCLSVKNVSDFLDAKISLDGLHARIHGMSQEEFKKWHEHVTSPDFGRCNAVTVKGSRCAGHVGAVVHGPGHYPKMSPYCANHRTILLGKKDEHAPA